MSTRPLDVVDVHGNGWHASIGTHGHPVYIRSGGTYASLNYTQLVEQHGKLKPIRPIDAAEKGALRELWEEAGEYAPAVLLSAWTALACQFERGTSGERAGRIIAGRAGSWESDHIRRVLIFGIGEGLSGPPIPSTSETLRRMTLFYATWVNAPGSFVEVVENTATVLGTLIDRRPGGFAWYRCGPWVPVSDRVRLVLASRAYATEHAGSFEDE